MDGGGNAQIHLVGVNGTSKFAQGSDKDPSRPHQLDTCRGNTARRPAVAKEGMS